MSPSETVCFYCFLFVFLWCLTAWLSLVGLSLLPDKLLQWEKDDLLFPVDECLYSYKAQTLQSCTSIQIHSR